MIRISLLCILILTISSHASAQERTIEFLSAPQIVANDLHLGILDFSLKKFYLFDYESGSLNSQLDALKSSPIRNPGE